MKINLEELERKACAASDITPWWTDRMPHAEHIQANSPPVTLALIARIRELEGFIAACDVAPPESARISRRDFPQLFTDADGDRTKLYMDEARPRILEKGTVIE